jgi:hypothetical protein
MKPLLNLLFTVLIGLLLIPGTAAQQQEISKKGEEVGPVTSTAGSRLTLNPNFGKIPLYFIPNKGQVNEKAKFYAKTSRYTLWMTKEGLVFDSARKVEVKAEVEEGATQPVPLGHPSQEVDTPRPLRGHPSQEGIIERDVSRLVLLKANKNPVIVPLEITQHKVNYYIGSDPGKWQKGISTSKAVLYKDIYKNIDLKVYGNESQVEYDWIVKPGGNPADIRFEYKNVKGARIDKKGNLLIKTKFGELLHKKPVSYQLIDGNTINIESKFKKFGRNKYGFAVQGYDKNKELIIDPVVSLEFSTFLGGSGFERGCGIAIDNSGNIFLCGYTSSSNFPITGSNDINIETCEIFITQLNSSGSDIILSTYIGGNDNDQALDMEIAESGYIYLTGITWSDNFPVTRNSRYGGGGDAFLCRFDPSGLLLYSRYIGGTNLEYGRGIAIDSSENAYIVGNTYSSDFPTLNAFQSSVKGYGGNAFVCKINYSEDFIYSTYLGGEWDEHGQEIAVDDSGSCYVTGYTHSSKFPVKNAYQEKYGGRCDGFVCKFNADGSDLIYSTFLGGTDSDNALGIVVDKLGSAYIAGRTSSHDFPVKNAFQNTFKGGNDVFVCKLNPDGTDLIYSTYLGGSNSEFWDGTNKEGGIAVDEFGCVYISGATYSIDFPTKNAFQDTNGGILDIFLFKLSEKGNKLVYSTYLGGYTYDSVGVVAVDQSGNAYVTGGTNSYNFPTKIPYQDSNAGYVDVFLSKLSFTYNVTIQSTPDIGIPITVTPNDTNGNGDGNTNFARTYSHGQMVTLTAPGIYNQKVFYKWTIDGVDDFNRTIQVTMNSGHTVTAVYQTWGELSLSRSQLYFGANTSGTSSGDQTFFISKGDGSTFNWTINDNASWLSCNPTSGTNAGEVTVSVNASGLAAGTYSGTITVSAPNASNSPQHVNVTMLVYKDNTTGVPFGYFETPKDGTYVYSSIPVTGWTLDDIEVENVKIYRKEGKELVYIGDAVFVDGARPDVEMAYPNYPKSYRAGWGYMMLTNFLPNGGNGTFTLHAIATDKEGNHVTLGTKTIECDNANAVRPFGAIDTPAQGGTASGTNYRNQGWVLTPLPNKIPEDGHTIIVWIDGIDVGKCKYNIYRSDIASLFPGYANSNGAMAYFDFDTTAYKNGVHTIQWTAVDNAGNVDGIGSRYFTTQNTGGSAERMAQSAERTAAVFNIQYSIFNVNPSTVPPDYSGPIRVKKGYNQNIKPQQRFPDETGNITIEIKELERLELQLFEGTRGLAPVPDVPGPSTNNRMGFLVVGNQLRKLPIGSTFNPQKGIFSWIPGPGFIGTYRFVFLEEKQNREWTKTSITVNILPKFTGKSD